MNLMPRTNSLIDSFLGESSPAFRLLPEMDVSRSLAVDISENDDSFVLKADFPGMRKEDIEVTLENDVLTLSGEHREESEEKDQNNGRVLRKERSYGRISRSFSLGQKIDEDNIKASFKDGVLTLELPKSERQDHDNGKRIPIQ